MAKRSKNQPSGKAKSTDTKGATNGMPWQSAPDAPKARKAPAAATTSTTSRTRAPRVTSHGAAIPASSPWMDTFEYAPWASGSTTLPPPPSIPPSVRARMQANQAYSSDDRISNYNNPWGGSAAGADGQPLTRREAIRVRAAAKRRAGLNDDQQAETVWGAEKEALEAVTKQTSETAEKAPSAPASEPAPAMGYKKRSEVWALKSQDISVESLPNGVINVLGDGLGVVIDTGISAGNSITSVLKAGVRAAPAFTATGLVGIAGASVIYGSVSSFPLAWKIL